MCLCTRVKVDVKHKHVWQGQTQHDNVEVGCKGVCMAKNWLGRLKQLKWHSQYAVCQMGVLKGITWANSCHLWFVSEWWSSNPHFSFWTFTYHLISNFSLPGWKYSVKWKKRQLHRFSVLLFATLSCHFTSLCISLLFLLQIWITAVAISLVLTEELVWTPSQMSTTVPVQRASLERTVR